MSLRTVLLFAAVSCATSTCTSSSPTQPTSSACPSSISPASLTMSAETASVATVTVAAAPSCAWEATSNAAFITVAGGSSTGPGAVNVTLSPNPGAARSGTVTIGGQTLTVNQQRSCGFTLSATTLTVSAAGGNAAVTVTAATGCAWSATSGGSFIAVTSGSSGNGSGSVAFTVAANAGPTREAFLTIAAHTVSVIQSGTDSIASCVTSICQRATVSPFGCVGGVGALVPGQGGTIDLGVFAPASCSWFLTTDPWLASDSPAGTGDRTIHLQADPNPASNFRLGAVAAGGVTLPVSQSACSGTVSPEIVFIAAEGATVTTTVLTSCASWTAAANVGFVTITDGATGSGNGTVTYRVAPNTGPARSGVVLISNAAAVQITQGGS